jgi:hypothetical protein
LKMILPEPITANAVDLRGGMIGWKFFKAWPDSSGIAT